MKSLILSALSACGPCCTPERRKRRRGRAEAMEGIAGRAQRRSVTQREGASQRPSQPASQTGQPIPPPQCQLSARERGSAPERGRHSTICFPPNASVQWQPDGLTIHIHTKKWFPGARFLGAPAISLTVGSGEGGKSSPARCRRSSGTSGTGWRTRSARPGRTGSEALHPISLLILSIIPTKIC